MGKQETMSAAEYQALYGSKKILLPVKTGVKKGRSSNSEPVIKDSIEVGNGWCRITLAGVIQGLNGSGGLMQKHWVDISKEKDAFILRVMALRAPKFPGKVRIIYTRFCAQFMDIDNMVSTAKLPLDALKANKVIVDDNPNWIISFTPNQVKCRRKDQRTVVFIEEVTPIPS